MFAMCLLEQCRPTVSVVTLYFVLVFSLFFNSAHGYLNNVDVADYEISMSNVNASENELHKSEEESVSQKSKVDKLGAVLKERIKALRNAPKGQVELVFLVDSSGSVGVENFYNELKFVKKLLADFTVAFDQARVAVITFSSRTLVHRVIDHLTNATARNHKCRLLNEEMHRFNYTGGGTFTFGAIVEAQMVFESSRPNAPKALFLLTDGYSNGFDPRPAADRLRRTGVEFFTFGIKNGNVRELLTMASEPKSQHCYILNSFAEFEALARRALHEDLHVGSYEEQDNTSCSSLCDGSEVCCDTRAVCTCGIHTGHYACVCPKGYYGTGMQGDCQPCPAGTYSEHIGPSEISVCKTCPDPNHESNEGSCSMQDCRCQNGYRQRGNQCDVVECPKMVTPDHGYILKRSCGNVYNDVCGFGCDDGYNLHGSSARLCTENGTWNGETAACIARTCSAPIKPQHGNILCDRLDLTFRSHCNFTCDKGFALVGSGLRICMADGNWDGTQSSCTPITCPPISPLEFGTVSPAKCTIHSSQHGELCTFKCNQGFTLIGPAKRSCTDGSIWSSSIKTTRCIDTTPPLLDCPPDVVVHTDEKENAANVTWDTPLPMDNSLEVPTLVSIPVISHPMKFRIGQTVINYISEDKAKNKATCNFTVEVLDVEPPTVDKCVSPPIFLSQSKSTLVEWEEPIFSDNSGMPVHVVKSHDFLHRFERGDTLVTYTAWDGSGNNSTCILTITIQENGCIKPADPINGHHNCFEKVDGVFCSLTCDEGYAFVTRPSDVYFCAYDGLWSPSNRLPFPDCSLTMLPTEALINSILIMRSEEIPCEDKFFIRQVENKIKRKLSGKVIEHCFGQIECDVDHVFAECEAFFPDVQEEDNYILRKRRSTSDDLHTYFMTEQKIAFKFQVKGKRNATSTELVFSNETSVSNELEKFFDRLENDAKLGELDIQMGKRQFRYNGLKLLANETRLVCDPGTVFRGDFCVKCPVGMYYNIVSEECQPCYKGSYQFMEGQYSCLICPENMTTSQMNSKTPAECKAQCLPGSFSSDGLEICETCPIGSYQTKYAQTACELCPKGLTTYRRGTIRQAGCREFCPPDFVSETGLAPCYPCPRCYHQPDFGQTACYRHDQQSLPLGLFNNCSVHATVDELEINDCFSIPCLNDGSCKALTFGYICECPMGFTGMNCETEIDECENFPCQNRGHCQDGLANYTCYCVAGFDGVNCEHNVDDCRSLPCMNSGTCFDLIDDVICQCLPGFEGRTCAMNVDECLSQPCANGGTCFDGVATYNCQCSVGFEGQFCEINIDECNSQPCFNGATCTDLINKFMCTCRPGFVGEFCQIDINECNSMPCMNEATCVDVVNAYKCFCPPGFSGLICETELSANFVLHFSKPSITDYAVLNGFQRDIESASLCFWIKTNDRDNYGTPVSYANDVTDNLFSLTDYNGFALYVNGYHVITDVTVNDGHWHFVCITWTSNGGVWHLYKDGFKADSGHGLANGSHIPGDGVLVIGQEQDHRGGAFSDSESFVGRLSRLDFWDTVLTSEKITQLMSTCDKYRGNLRAWSDFLAGLKGKVQIEDSPFCKGCPPPNLIDNGKVVSEGNGLTEVISYICDYGYSATPNATERVQCLISGDWSEHAPKCERKSCGFPGYLINGHIKSNGYFYKDVITYYCDNGYGLSGDNSRQCLDTGQWGGSPPVCVDILCPPLNDIMEHVEILQMPSQLRVSSKVVLGCTDGHRLDGTSELTCLPDGTWDEDVPLCQPIDCKRPPVVKHGYVINGTRDANKVSAGQTLTFACDPGYILKGGDELPCSDKGKWIGEVPRCEPIDCGSPISIANATVIMDGTLFGSYANYSCIVGFEFSNETSVQVRCSDSGSWESPFGVLPTCTPVLCPMPQGIRFGDVKVGSFAVGSVANYSCMDGYDIVGNSRRTCTSEGTWDGTNPMCSETKCPTPDLILNGNFSGTGPYMPGVTIRYVCDLGFRHEGQLQRTCLSSGRWSQPAPICTIMQCPVPKAIVNGFSVGASYDYMSVITYHCAEGYRVEGPSVRRCTVNGTWSDTEPKCLIVYCGSVNNVKNGKIFFDTFFYQSRIFHECDPEFKLVGSEWRTCLANGSWSDQEPYCEPTQCPPPEPLPNGAVTLSNGLAHYKCDAGYVLLGDERKTCDLMKRAWIGPAIIDVACVPINCTAPEQLLSGFIRVACLTYGCKAEYHCLPGFKLVGSSVRECLKHGYWSEDGPSCHQVTCLKQLDISNGQIIGDSHVMGAIVQFQCDVGYHLIGADNMTCQESGTWSANRPSCVSITCPMPLLPPTNGHVIASGHQFKDVANYSCQVGYQLLGNEQRICLSNGSWSNFDSPIQCVPIQCDLPDQIEHGSFVLPDGPFFNMSVNYKCNLGYDLIGNSMQHCQADGSWSGSETPVCKSISCDTLPPDIDNGSFNVSGFELGSVVKYSCHRGYRMEGSDILECNNSGHWIGENLPQCLPIHCTDAYPPPLHNGKVLDSGNRYDDILVFTCDRGFSLVGESKIRCNESGQWSSQFPVCAKTACPSPSKLNNGYIAGQEFLAEGIEVTYACDVGYKLAGSANRICLNGKWQGSPANCIPITCRHPGDVLHGKSSTSKQTFFFGDNVTYECDKGFRLENMSQPLLACLQNETWTSTPPKCEPITCPAHDELPFATKLVNSNDISTPQSLLPGTVVNYSCINGYVMEDGSKYNSTECLLDGRWSHPKPPRCRPVSCGRPLEVEHARVTYTSILLHAVVEYECNSGYRPISGKNRTTLQCNEHGIWSGEMPRCERIQCPQLPLVAGGRLQALHGDGMSYESAVYLDCHFEFHLIGSALRICTADGTWSGSDSFCELNQCPLPHDIIDGIFELGGTLVGGNVLFRCHPGYELIGSPMLTCMFNGHWSADQPHCRQIVCPQLKELQFGLVVITHGGIVGSLAHYNCNHGYKLDQEQEYFTRRCLENGTWSGSEPACAEINCAKPEPISNGHLPKMKEHYNVGDVQLYACHDGYELQGSNARICQDDGTFSDAEPKCKMVTCPNLRSLTNGQILGNLQRPYTVNSIITFKCSPLYQLQGLDTLRCLSSGRWNGKPPICIRTVCDMPPNISNAILLGDGYSRTHFVGDTVNYMCKEGFATTEMKNMSLRCLDDGRWEGDLPLCLPVQCGAPPKVPDALFVVPYVPPEQNENSYGTTVQYVCRDGYENFGSVALVCGADGFWKGDMPRCRRLPCGPLPLLPIPARTYIQIENYKRVSRAVYLCQEGYTIFNASTIFQCLESGRWDLDLLRLESISCVPLNCGEPAKIAHGTVTSTGTEYGDVAHYNCGSGYRLTGGTAKMVCGSQGRWKGQLPRCKLVTCPVPDIPSNGLVHSQGEFHYGMKVTFTCRKGYRLIGNIFRRCSQDGTWSGGIPHCKLIQCEEPIPPIHGYVMVDDRKLGSVARYICDDGYQLLGENVTECGYDAEWTTATPVCSARMCPRPPIPPNAIPNRPLRETHKPGDQVHFRCFPNHFSISKLLIQCLPNGTWSQLHDQCKDGSKINCGRPRAHNGAVIHGTSFKYGDRVIYSCPPGHHRNGSGILLCQENGHWNSQALCEGITCRTPCLNGGTCIDGDRCHCSVGYFGSHCELAVCILPCLNGGTCFRPYRCLCRRGYVGGRCQIPILRPGM